MRRPFSILLTLAVLATFSEAPFLHTHLHAETQGHPAPLFHLHLKWVHSTSTSPELRGLDPNDDAQYQSWFSATPTAQVSMTPVIVAEPFVLAALEQNGWTVEAPLPNGHDPPQFAPLAPRAPPA